MGSGDSELTDFAITVLIVGATTPLLVFLILRLIKPSFGDLVVRSYFILSSVFARAKLKKQVNKVIPEQPICKLLNDAIDEVFTHPSTGELGRRRAEDAVALLVEVREKEYVAENYQELKHEALSALCEAVGLEVQHLQHLEKTHPQSESEASLQMVTARG